MKVLLIRWSEEAVRNLDAIIEHIGLDAPERAATFRRKVARIVGRLRTFPESGRLVPELSEQIPAPREVLIGDYRVIYRLVFGRVEIVTMIHGRRLLGPSA